MASPVGPRLSGAARWLAPSAVAACAGALAAGAVDGASAGDALGVAASIGFLGALALPLLLAASAAIRGVVAAWRPDRLGAALTEDGGGAPRLAAWLAVIVLGALALAAIVHRGVWLLAAWTAFKPLSVGFAVAMLAAAAALLLIAVAYPAARLLAELARRLDARWRRGPGNRASLWRPRRVLAGAALAGGAIAALLWLVVIRPRLGPIDLGVLDAPAAAGLAVIAVHAAWRWLPRARRVAGAVIAAAAIAAIAIAGFVRFARPALALQLWGDRPLAGLAIDLLCDLDALRDDIDLAVFRPEPRPGAAHPDIVLITIDTVRADHTPPYGGRAEMPALRSIGERGRVFAWAFAPSNVTRRSITSMTIGLAPDRIRGRVVGWALRIDPRHVLLAERLRAGGYDTAGFMCCKGFWGPEARTGLARGLAHVEIEQTGSRLAALGRAWLEAREQRPGNAPLFVWMHVLEPHNWIKLAGDQNNPEQRTRAYDRTLAQSDAMIAELLRPFAGRPAERAPIVIITADHGEALGEHGQPFHSTDLYNSQIRVPLILAGPGIATGRADETVSLTDLVPTILDLAGFVVAAGPGTGLDGRSIADLATGARPSADTGLAYAAMIKDRSNPGGVAAIVRGTWKLIETARGAELYDLAADPDEKRDLAATRPALVGELRALLRRKQAAGKASPFTR